MPQVGQVPAELDRVRALYRERNPRRVLEIGVWYGGTLREWLATRPELVVAVDPEPRVDPSDWPYVIFIKGYSQREETRRQIVSYAPYDWVFIDGDHDEGVVAQDVELALSVTRPGGLILLHDIVADELYAPHGTGPGRVFESHRGTWKIVEDLEGSGYPPNLGHGIGVLERA